MLNKNMHDLLEQIDVDVKIKREEIVARIATQHLVCGQAYEKVIAIEFALVERINSNKDQDDAKQRVKLFEGKCILQVFAA